MSLTCCCSFETNCIRAGNCSQYSLIHEYVFSFVTKISGDTVSQICNLFSLLLSTDNNYDDSNK